MKFTLSWLKDHLDTGASLDDITYALTDLGLEVEEVVDRTAAESLQGAELSIETEEWEDAEEEWYDADLVGLPARTPGGEPLGEVTAVEHLPAQDLLVVRYEGREVLVPFVTAIVTEVSEDGVVIDAPGGLFDGEEA